MAGSTGLVSPPRQCTTCGRRLSDVCGRCYHRGLVPVQDPFIREGLDAAAEILRAVADALADEAATRAGDRGAVRHSTPGRVIRLYELAERVEGWPG